MHQLSQSVRCYGSSGVVIVAARTIHLYPPSPRTTDGFLGGIPLGFPRHVAAALRAYNVGVPGGMEVLSTPSGPPEPGGATCAQYRAVKECPRQTCGAIRAPELVH